MRHNTVLHGKEMSVEDRETFTPLMTPPSPNDFGIAWRKGVQWASMQRARLREDDHCDPNSWSAYDDTRLRPAAIMPLGYDRRSEFMIKFKLHT